MPMFSPKREHRHQITMFDLSGKVALVTGGRRGMGKSHALALAAQGAKVVVTDVDAGECAAVVEEIKSKGSEAVCFKMDVSNKEEVNSVFDEVIKQFGRLDILVNNAGIYFPKMALELTEEDWDKMVSINLKGEFLCAQRAAKEMAKNKSRWQARRKKRHGPMETSIRFLISAGKYHCTQETVADGGKNNVSILSRPIWQPAVKELLPIIF